MPSNALKAWLGESQKKLEELIHAHGVVGGNPGMPGRRYATEQINHAYVVAVAAHFQRFCRDIHTEAAGKLAAVVPTSLNVVVMKALTANRKLDGGNAHDGSLGPDFQRLGFQYPKALDDADARNKVRRHKLNQLNAWRNAIVHQNFAFTGETQVLVGATKPNFAYARSARWNCGVLAEQIDLHLGLYVQSVVGPAPW